VDVGGNVTAALSTTAKIRPCTSAASKYRQPYSELLPVRACPPPCCIVASTCVVIAPCCRVKAIENLSIMSSLVKLRLDNNEIGEMPHGYTWDGFALSGQGSASVCAVANTSRCAETISGLEALVNLKELDLSFNRITAIQGMSTLTQLTDISLFSNKITSIEHLDAQIDSLESFSIGRNLLHETRSIVYLRKFQKLRILCMEGNFKGTDVSEYRGSTLALLPQLRYLDWTLITDSERKAAQETHHRVVTELPEVTGQLDHAHAALTGSEATLGSTSMANGVDANIAANAAAVREAGLQYAAYVWRIMMDP
jgi:hypothetical protein